jgi:hypothetical protein
VATASLDIGIITSRPGGSPVEVKIGIAESARELVVSSDQKPDDVQALVNEALASENGLLRLDD